MTFQEPPSSEPLRDITTDRPQPKMHPRDLRLNAFLFSCAEVIAWIGRIIFLLGSIYIIFQTIMSGIFLETLITIMATILIFYVSERTALERFFDWTIEDWRDTEKPAKRSAYKLIVTTTNTFIVVVMITAGVFFTGYSIDMIREIGILILVAILATTILVILFLERTIPIVDRLISPRIIVNDPNADEQNKNGEE